MSLMLLAVLIRVLVRIRFTRRWEWDDYSCVLATVCLTIFSGDEAHHQHRSGH
ncbi:hypothetical protein F5Y19DRAFT_431655 [Xylariaceae sp. FL1651]|nr:hypothetical protein F5Y19DRAFT_431655 [Xylariaceae sp. FL1651]